MLLYPTILLWCKTSLAWLQLPSSYYILLLLVHAQLYIAVYIGQGFKKGLTFAQNSMTLVRVSSERCNWYYICNKHVWYEEKHLVAHAIPTCSFQWNKQYKIQAFLTILLIYYTLIVTKLFSWPILFWFLSMKK